MRTKRPVIAMKDAVAAVMGHLAKQHETAGEGGVGGALKKVLTKKDLEHIKVKYFRDGILALGIDSSAWLYKLSLEKPVLLERLKSQIKTLKDVRLSIGE